MKRYMTLEKLVSGFEEGNRKLNVKGISRRVVLELRRQRKLKEDIGTEILVSGRNIEKSVVIRFFPQSLDQLLESDYFTKIVHGIWI